MAGAGADADCTADGASTATAGAGETEAETEAGMVLLGEGLDGTAGTTGDEPAAAEDTAAMDDGKAAAAAGEFSLVGPSAAARDAAASAALIGCTGELSALECSLVDEADEADRPGESMARGV